MLLLSQQVQRLRKELGGLRDYIDARTYAQRVHNRFNDARTKSDCLDEWLEQLLGTDGGPQLLRPGTPLFRCGRVPAPALPPGSGHERPASGACQRRVAPSAASAGLGLPHPDQSVSLRDAPPPWPFFIPQRRPGAGGWRPAGVRLCQLLLRRAAAPAPGQEQAGGALSSNERCV